ncbi:MAG: hypothetical protein ACREX3_11905 [Gammaproteobacteria bacterium]
MLFVLYALTGTAAALVLSRFGKAGMPVGLAAWWKETYRPQGHKWLLVVRSFVIATPVVVILLLVFGRRLCN